MTSSFMFTPNKFSNKVTAWLVGTDQQGSSTWLVIIFLYLNHLSI